MTIFGNTTKSLTCLYLASMIIPFQCSYADVYKTSTGHCVLTSKEYIEGGYHNPNNGEYWKYVPCDDATAKKESKKTPSETQDTKQNTKKSKPFEKLKGSLRGAVSTIRDNLRVCLPFTADSCSRTPDTIPVSLLDDNANENALTHRVEQGVQSGRISLKGGVINTFPKIVKRARNGSYYINFEQLAQVCQALQNDPRYVTASGELSRRPSKNSILNNYGAAMQLATLCHELIHMGDCAACVSEHGTEKKAYEYEVRVARKASELAPKAVKPSFLGYLYDRTIYVNYLTCRETYDNYTCYAQCVQAGHATNTCKQAYDIYGARKPMTVGEKHNDEKNASDLARGIFGIGVLDQKVQETPENQSSGNASLDEKAQETAQNQSSGNASQPSGAITKFALSNGTIFTCPSGNVGFRVVGSDSIERGYCCPAGSSTVTVGTNHQGQCA